MTERLVPKVLVATQTKVVEAVADPEGRLRPVGPGGRGHAADPAEVWAVTAALSAPPVSAWALAPGGRCRTGRRRGEALGEADPRGARSRWTTGLWAEVAARLAAGDLPAAEFAALMTRAYGLPGRRPRGRLVARPPPRWPTVPVDIEIGAPWQGACDDVRTAGRQGVIRRLRVEQPVGPLSGPSAS